MNDKERAYVIERILEGLLDGAEIEVEPTSLDSIMFPIIKRVNENSCAHSLCDPDMTKDLEYWLPRTTALRKYYAACGKDTTGWDRELRELRRIPNDSKRRENAA